MDKLREFLQGVDGIAIEWIKYPIYLVLTLLTLFAALLFVSDFLAKRKELFSGLAEMKSSIYSTKWMVITLASLLAFFSVLAIIWPAGFTSYPFAGDLLFWIASLSASVLLILDVFVNKKPDIEIEIDEDPDNENEMKSVNDELTPVGRFLNRFLWLAGMVIGILAIIHLLIPTVVIL